MTPPFDIAVAYARANGIGPDLLSALRDFMDGLTGIAAAQVTHLKCRAGLLFILDAETGRARQRCWSDRFRAGVLALPDEEQARWRQLVLGMAANQVYEMPRVWRQEASRFLESLSPEVVVQRLAAWWPDPRVSTVWPIQTAGGHLLKYLIWLLGVAADVGDLRPQCLDLVCRLSELDWKPRERGQKVMVTAAFYLRSIPVEISWPALQRLARWSSLAPGGSEEGKINEILQRYCREHELELPALEPAEVAGR